MHAAFPYHSLISGWAYIMHLLKLLYIPAVSVVLWFWQPVPTTGLGEWAGVAAFTVLVLDRLFAFAKWALERKSKFSTETLLSQILDELKAASTAATKLQKSFGDAQDSMQRFSSEQRKFNRDFHALLNIHTSVDERTKSSTARRRKTRRKH